MHERMRFYATGVLWFFLSALTIGLFTIPSSAFANASPGVALAVLITLAITAMMSTIGIWGQLTEGEGSSENIRATVAKQKRVPANERQLARLVDTLDDDDLDMLEALLAERDAGAQCSVHR